MSTAQCFTDVKSQFLSLPVKGFKSTVYFIPVGGGIMLVVYETASQCLKDSGL